MSILRIALIFCLFISFLGPLPTAAALTLPAPGERVALSPSFSPVVLKGLKIDPANPLRFDFYIDRGEATSNLVGSETAKLIKYFLASLTVPEKDLWVNLSPYEKDRIVPDGFGQTQMGRDLLAQDYLLKQITASLIYPEDEIGKKFWKRVYVEAQKRFNTTDIPVNTFNKVWIVPAKAVVYEKNGTAFILENHLKVMLESDYLAQSKNVVSVNDVGSQIIREIVIPELEKEVNTGKNLAQLRQAFYSLILATWYKKKIKDSILNKVYANTNKTHDLSSPHASSGDPQTIYQQYLQAFKKGVFNYIKEEPILSVIPKNAGIQTTPRKYFSGGVEAMRIGPAINYTNTIDSAQLIGLEGRLTSAVVDIKLDHAMQVADLNWKKGARVSWPELVRFKSQRRTSQIQRYSKYGKTPNLRNYGSNSIDVRQVFIEFIKKLADKEDVSFEDFVKAIERMHQYLIQGKSGKSFYVPPTFWYKRDKAAYLTQREALRDMADEKIVLTTSELVSLEEALNILKKIVLSSRASEVILLEQIATFYYTMMHVKLNSPHSERFGFLFSAGNNSLMMNMVNGLLRLKGFNPIAHGDLDREYSLSELRKEFVAKVREANLDKAMTTEVLESQLRGKARESLGVWMPEELQKILDIGYKELAGLQVIDAKENAFESLGTLVDPVQKQKWLEFCLFVYSQIFSYQNLQLKISYDLYIEGELGRFRQEFVDRKTSPEFIQNFDEFTQWVKAKRSDSAMTVLFDNVKESKIVESFDDSKFFKKNRINSPESFIEAIRAKANGVYNIKEFLKVIKKKQWKQGFTLGRKDKDRRYFEITHQIGFTDFINANLGVDPRFTKDFLTAILKTKEPVIFFIPKDVTEVRGKAYIELESLFNDFSDQLENLTFVFGLYGQTIKLSQETEANTSVVMKADNAMSSLSLEVQQLWERKVAPIWGQTFNASLMVELFNYSEGKAESMGIEPGRYAADIPDNPNNVAIDILIDSILNRVKIDHPSLWQEKGHLVEKYLMRRIERPSDPLIDTDSAEAKTLADIALEILLSAETAFLETNIYGKTLGEEKGNNAFLHPFIYIDAILGSDELKNQQYINAKTMINEMVGNGGDGRGTLKARLVADKLTLSIRSDMNMDSDVHWQDKHVDIKHSVFRAYLEKGDIIGFVDLLASNKKDAAMGSVQIESFDNGKALMDRLKTLLADWEVQTKVKVSFKEGKYFLETTSLVVNIAENRRYYPYNSWIDDGQIEKEEKRFLKATGQTYADFFKEKRLLIVGIGRDQVEPAFFQRNHFEIKQADIVDIDTNNYIGMVMSWLTWPEADKERFVLYRDDIKTFNAPPESYDMIFSNATIEWAVLTKKLSDTVKNVDRLLKKGGIFMGKSDAVFPDNLITLSDLSAFDFRILKKNDVAMNVLQKGGIDFNPSQMDMEIKKQETGTDFLPNSLNAELASVPEDIIGASFTIQSMTPITPAKIFAE